MSDGYQVFTPWLKSGFMNPVLSEQETRIFSAQSKLKRRWSLAKPVMRDTQPGQKMLSLRFNHTGADVEQVFRLAKSKDETAAKERS